MHRKKKMSEQDLDIINQCLQDEHSNSFLSFCILESGLE